MKKVLKVIIVSILIFIGLVYLYNQKNQQGNVPQGMNKPDFTELHFQDAVGDYNNEKNIDKTLKFTDKYVRVHRNHSGDDYDADIEIGDIKSGNSCKTSQSLFTRIFISKDEKVLLINNYDGSSQFMDIVDIDSCKTTTNIDITGLNDGKFSSDYLEFDSKCDIKATTKDDKVVPDVYYCFSSKVFNIDSKYHTSFYQEASDALTKKDTGVNFNGEKFIDDPRTPKARIDPYPEKYNLPG